MAPALDTTRQQLYFSGCVAYEGPNYIFQVGLA